MLQNKILVLSAIFAFFLVFSQGAQLTGAPRGQNHTRRGICTLEVPTIDLLSPEDRRGIIPRGNGSREGFSKIEVCCSGYAKTPHTHLACEPICDGCQNGNCTAPNVCVCRRGWIKDLDNNCIPSCPLGCLNGVCTNNGVCSCNAGNIPSPDGKFCVPHCTGGCGTGGKCIGPEVCQCAEGFSLNPDNKCGYYCEGGCGEGTCIGPNKCSCKPGYKLSGGGAGSCIPDCPRGCMNGKCVAPNKCACEAGWNLDVQTGAICTPHCDYTCLNGDCVAPNKCACKKGYVEAPGTTRSEKCVAFCPGGCPNGVCSAPNFCICNPGYIKEAKGSNVCIRRLKRSVVHFELIPQSILEGN